MSAPEIDRSIWQGRIDPEENSERWHQKIQSFKTHSPKGTVLIGFCCDEGVRRNHGRVGAKQAPDAIRKALANLAGRCMRRAMFIVMTANWNRRSLRCAKK